MGASGKGPQPARIQLSLSVSGEQLDFSHRKQIEFSDCQSPEEAVSEISGFYVAQVYGKALRKQGSFIKIPHVREWLTELTGDTHKL